MPLARYRSIGAVDPLLGPRRLGLGVLPGPGSAYIAAAAPEAPTRHRTGRGRKKPPTRKTKEESITAMNNRSSVLASVFGVTDLGRRRANNEDAFLISDLGANQVIQSTSGGWHESRPVGASGLLLSVSDGMGGAAAGELASAMTVGAVREWLMEAYAGGDRSHLRAAVARASDEVQRASQVAERQGMGATLSAVFVKGTAAHVASVGDSRVYLVRGQRITLLTRDHTYVQYLVDNNVISRDDAERSPYGNILLQAMGRESLVSIDLGRLELRRGDRFLLCSDGLSRKVAEKEMRDVVLGCGSLEAGCRELVDLANARGGEDNITVVLAVVTGRAIPRFAEGEDVEGAIVVPTPPG
jgi:serine/threonine protein phosphatase PrpC